MDEEETKIYRQIEQLESIVKPVLTKQALERYGNLKTAHPEKAVQLLFVLGQAIQSGRTDSIDDEQLKSILIRMAPEKKEFRMRMI